MQNDAIHHKQTEPIARLQVCHPSDAKGLYEDV